MLGTTVHDQEFESWCANARARLLDWYHNAPSSLQAVIDGETLGEWSHEHDLATTYHMAWILLSRLTGRYSLFDI
jgi:hypothetical protein